MKTTHTVNEQKTTTMTQKNVLKSRKQAGFSLMDFVFWMGLAALVAAGVVGMAASGKGKQKIGATVTDVTEMRAATDAWVGGIPDATGVSLTEICKEGYGYSKAAWCRVNQYGGTYTVTVNTSNKSLIDVVISKVEKENVNALANRLATMSAERCIKADASCSSVKVTTNNITVTL
ncbi:hypothetical protein VH1709_contig00039-0024 [Vibrio harveyi]|uniref:hypothetical protein n=1 Tax=Vibrio harveyi TaxID=669 RepID=UPI000D785438|nr:hypothetical protein [Vibrio harveyi]GBK99868.1 hypothetical protein VH1709_contig00039-0024 [Vibrio harveyi]